MNGAAPDSDLVLANTVISRPFLCPEIRLRLITPECALWKAGEKDLREMRLPDPYWGFAWAGGQALARYVLDRPEMVDGKRVLDFGAGCGIEAIAAAKAGASHVLASDVDEVAAAAISLNADLNGVDVSVTTKDLLGDPLPEIDVILAGDMFYDPEFSRRALDWFSSLASAGKIVLLGDPGRGNLADAPLARLATYMAPADVDIGGHHLRETWVCKFRI